MTKISDGGPAFPHLSADPEKVNQLGQSILHPEPGMSLRDWFAGRAMQGMQGNPEFDRNTSSQIAQQACVMADAMLAARNEGESE